MAEIFLFGSSESRLGRGNVTSLKNLCLYRVIVKLAAQPEIEA